jgi:hypothetical protein
VTTRPILILLALVALALPGAATAQGLGDAAAREKAKREAPKKAGETKVFTNEDLHEGQTGTPAATSAAPSSENAAAEGARREADPDVEDRPAEETGSRAQEQPYLQAMAAAQSRVTELEARIKELQARLNPMSTTYVYGDFNGLGGDKLAEEAQVKAELAQAEGDLDTARQALVDATRAVQDFRQGRPTPLPVPR